MAKAANGKKDKKETAAATGTVTIKDLSEKLGVEARVLRQHIRSLGLKAPEVKQEGFGPRAKYEWDANDPDLKKILKSWEEKEKAAGE